MKKLLTILFSMLVASLFAQVNVTFQVDMSGQSVSSDGVHVAGSFNGWNTSANMLADQGNDIYAVTLSLVPGQDYEYKYLNGNVWGTEETPPAACSVATNNRIFTAPATDIILTVTPFGGCPSPNPTQTVTFNVDMTGITVSGDGVHVVGNFNGWSPGLTMMTDVGSNIYQVTVTVLSSITNLQYKYLNGNNWGTEESIPAPCVNANNNRESLLEGAGPVVNLPVYEFGTCIESSLPLPVELLYFSGNKVAEGIALDWQTLSEHNNLGFQVERSKDGKRWEKLNFVEGNRSTSATQDYNYLDRTPFAGTNYYQLKQIDLDGQFVFSNVVSVASESTALLVSTYPNPVQDELNIINATGQLTLYDAIGQPRKSLPISDTHFSMDMSDLVPGIYLLTIVGADGSSYSKTIIK